jgi:CheY-like chemotaxis protein
MAKRVLDIGNCPPDHAAIQQLIEGNFDAVVLQAHQAVDALAILAKQCVDLVLVNRKLDSDYSDGLAVIKTIKATPDLSNVPVMMLTNFEEHQQRAMRAGAERGFGKLEFDDPATLATLRRFLGDAATSEPPPKSES